MIFLPQVEVNINSSIVEAVHFGAQRFSEESADKYVQAGVEEAEHLSIYKVG